MTQRISKMGHTFSEHPYSANMVPSSGLITSVYTDSITPDASPAIICSLFCIQYATCFSFFINMLEGRCQLYKSQIFDESHLVSENGWRLYTVAVRLPYSCAEAKSCGSSEEGFRWIQPNASLPHHVKLYCDSADKAYIPLNGTLNFFEKKGSADSCSDIATIRTNYSKISVNMTTLQVDIHDTRFAEKQGEDFLTYGMVKDCSAVKSASCLRPKGSINLIGTGFKISQSIWLSWGYKSEIQQFSRNTNNTEVTFACAGYCGNCGLKAGLLLLEVIGQQDEMKMEDIVYCRG